MWKVEYTKRFLKELSETPEKIRIQAEGIVFEELLVCNPFSLGYMEHMRGYPDIIRFELAQFLGGNHHSLLIGWTYGRRGLKPHGYL